MRVVSHNKRTQIIFPSKIPIKELNEYELDLLSRLASPGGQDTFTTLCNALEVSPLHAQVWGPELFALNKPKLASIAYHKAAEFENLAHRQRSTQTSDFNPEGHQLTPYSALALNFHLNSFTIAYIQKMIHDVDVDSLKFIWEDFSGNSSSFSYLSFHKIYSYSKIHFARNAEESTFLLKICLKIRPEWTHRMIVEDVTFYRLILFWKFPSSNNPVVHKNLLDIRYYLQTIEKQQKGKENFGKKILSFFC